MNLMIADQSDVVRKVAKRILTGMNFEVLEARNAAEATARCMSALPQFVIVEAAMDGALELIQFIRSVPGNENTRIYYCIVEADLRKMMAGRRAGANDFLMKPFDRKTLGAVFNGLAQPAGEASPRQTAAQ
ncbi:response regulator [Rhizobium sp. C1]|uniref:response regulator n=1 Tax=Rhizobium sp. C1 TaxID=1349799 RepID=UPI001E29DC10|nr:response regulator [Rhizobium sp. C1]MCD2180141.1 response regulator [Rhizobium sp. C1]